LVPGPEFDGAVPPLSVSSSQRLRFARHVEVKVGPSLGGDEAAGTVLRIFIDGVEFPFYVADGGIRVEYGEHGIPVVWVGILADNLSWETPFLPIRKKDAAPTVSETVAD
jgi:hypothetical protein